jgi:ABC-2 type transport system permease protein
MASESDPAWVTLLRARLAILRNLILDFRKDSIAKVLVLALGLTLVLAIGYGVSRYSFRFIEEIPPIGFHLNSRLLGLLFLVLFAMVTVSTAIVSYTTLFLARETRFFFELPLPPGLLFFTKTFESIAFSGWATLALCFPILVAFGEVRRAPWGYYPLASGMLIAFIVLCGLCGTSISLLLLSVVRRWTIGKISAVAVALMALMGWGFLSSFDFSALNGEENLQALNRFTMELGALESVFYPSTWATTALLSASTGHYREFFFHAGVLVSNTLILLPLLGKYAETLYRPRWLVTAEPHSTRKAQRAQPAAGEHGRPGESDLRHGPMAALLRKDLLSFLRDPSQVSQFLLFVVLTLVYVLSLIQIPLHLFSKQWRLVVFFANITAISLILSSLTSRFLFPLISLEGKAFWIIGLAPWKRVSLVRQKVWFGRAIIIGLGGLAGLSSSLSLGYSLEQTLSAMFSIALSGWLLTALAVGFGAAYPNLSEDNPARIAVGFGGTLNFFTSAVAICALVAIEAVPYFLAESFQAPLYRYLAHLMALAFALILSRLAVQVGERALERMEF